MQRSKPRQASPLNLTPTARGAENSTAATTGRPLAIVPDGKAVPGHATFAWRVETRPTARAQAQPTPPDRLFSSRRSTRDTDGESAAAPTARAAGKAKMKATAAPVVASTKPVSAFAKRKAYSESLHPLRSSRDRDRRNAARMDKLESVNEQAAINSGTVVEERATVREDGSRKRKRDTEPSRPSTQPTIRVGGLDNTTAEEVQAAEEAALAHADLEAQVARLSELNRELHAENQRLRAYSDRVGVELERVVAASSTSSTGAALPPTSPLDWDGVFSASSTASWPSPVSTQWGAPEVMASSRENGIEPFRASAVASPLLLSPSSFSPPRDWIDIQLSPRGAAAPLVAPPTGTAAPSNGNPFVDLQCDWPDDDHDQLDDPMRSIWTHFDDDAARGVVVAEPLPTTPATASNRDNTRSDWSVDSL